MVEAIPVNIPNGKSGPWMVDDIEISEDRARMENLRFLMNRQRDLMVAPGTYKRLTRNGTVVMSNTPFEIRTNRPILYRAFGHILINGLGIGMVLKKLLESPDVKKVTVIEASEDVIKLVHPTFAGFITAGLLEIIHADAFTYNPPKDALYDSVWHDIWDNVEAENFPQMTKLHRKYSRKCAWQDSWCRKECQRMAREDRAYSRNSGNAFE